MNAPFITCPICGLTSWHPKDVEHGYCGNCHAFTSAPCEVPPEAFAEGTERCPNCGHPPSAHPRLNRD